MHARLCSNQHNPMRSFSIWHQFCCSLKIIWCRHVCPIVESIKKFAKKLRISRWGKYWMCKYAHINFYWKHFAYAVVPLNLSVLDVVKIYNIIPESGSGFKFHFRKPKHSQHFPTWLFLVFYMPPGYRANGCFEYWVEKILLFQQ